MQPLVTHFGESEVSEKLKLAVSLPCFIHEATVTILEEFLSALCTTWYKEISFIRHTWFLIRAQRQQGHILMKEGGQEGKRGLGVPDGLVRGRVSSHQVSYPFFFDWLTSAKSYL